MNDDLSQLTGMLLGAQLCAVGFKWLQLWQPTGARFSPEIRKLTCREAKKHQTVTANARVQASVFP